jgi:cytochrome c-type biogenesis protein CcmH/NrfG
VKKGYAAVGLGVAVVVAITIVAVGVGSSSGGDGQPTASASAPSSQPDTSPTGTTSSTTVESPRTTLRQTINKLQREHAASPNNVVILLKLGDANFLGQRYLAAAKAYQQALVIRPANVTATVRLAMVWHAEGRTQQAVAAIKGVISKAPNDQEAHYSLAIVYFSMDQVSPARDEWQKAAKINPDTTIGRRSQSFVDLIDGNQASKEGGGD